MHRFGLESIKSTCRPVQVAALAAVGNPLIQLPAALLLLVPLVATIGQYVSTGYIVELKSVPLLFWPGVDGQVAPGVPVWLAMGAMLISYVAGILHLARRRNLAKVALLGFITMLVASGLAAIINSVTGWQPAQDMGGMDLAGKANAAIFSLWHNPIWEEIVFRGIPFIMLLAVVKGVRNERASFWAKAGYLVLPSLAFSLYHLPNHGASRLVDTFILGLSLAWMTIRFSFWAPLVLHCMFDAMMIPTIGSQTNVLPEEITWLTSHHGLLNGMSSLGMLLFLALVPILFAWYWRNHRRSGEDTAGSALPGRV